MAMQVLRLACQCPHDLKFINCEANVEGWKPSDTDPNASASRYSTCCTDIDSWEANKMSMAYMMHSCSVAGHVAKAHIAATIPATA